jgi:restriction system protein
MKTTSAMPRSYLALAEERVNYKLEGYFQPEYFEYNFAEWVSPYTKGAHEMGGVAVILQDWSSFEGLSGGVSPEVQEHGRTLDLKTNKRLEELLQQFFQVGIAGVYGTNVFPFIKKGGMSSPIPMKDIKRVSEHFLKEELRIAQPSCIIALGRKAQYSLEYLGVKHVAVPHPAARIGSIDKHMEAWKVALSDWKRGA